MTRLWSEYIFCLFQRRNDREEIRRRLAMGSDTDDYYGGERASKKPSLQARLQSGTLSILSFWFCGLKLYLLYTLHDSPHINYNSDKIM